MPSVETSGAQCPHRVAAYKFRCRGKIYTWAAIFLVANAYTWIAHKKTSESQNIYYSVYV